MKKKVNKMAAGC